jgi:DNA-binding LytR/AlgR family response regulator
MTVLKIGIVEDELIIAGNIIRALTELGYQTTEPAVSYTEAIAMVEEEEPDLLLLDINLSGKKDGIDVAAFINQQKQIPFIFLTANSDITTLERAKRVNPNAYLIKPFTKEDLHVSIEVAFNNYNTYRQMANASPVASPAKRKAIFLRNKQSFTKVLFSNILFVESAGNYVNIYLTGEEKLLYRYTITEFLELLPAEDFYRIHRGYIVQLNAVQKIDEGELQVAGHTLPVGKDRMKGLLELLHIGG